MSAIQGKGWGESHDWQRGETVMRITVYQCRACKVVFHHAYAVIPGIHEAMHHQGIPNECPASSDAATPKENTDV